MKFMVKVVLLVATLISAPAMAQNIAVLGVQEALLKSEAAKTFREDLKKKFSSDQKQLVQLEKQAKAARDKLQKNKDLASQDELKKMRLQFQKAFGEFQKRAQAFQKKQAQAEQAFLKQMRPKLDAVIRELIKDKNYDVIVAKQATLYANNKFDITAQVVELLNKAK